MSDKFETGFVGLVDAVGVFVVEDVAGNTEGEIQRVDLLPPFACLGEVSENAGGSERISENPAIYETGG